MSTGADRGDDGSALILVLVLVIITSLVVIPLLSYAVSVLRANEVVGERTAEAEAVKAGFRYAMAEPYELYDSCGGAGLNVGVPLDSPGLAIPTQTTCYLVDTATVAEADQLPYSVVTTFSGTPPPSGAGIIEPVYPGSGDAIPSRWIDESAATPTPATVWLPNLPVHGLNLRSGGGFEMPAGYPLNGYSECTVYFPGTYRSEIVIDGPTYFTSGIYYFERKVTLAGGADVVAGAGSTYQGCSDDQYSAFYAINAPATHNITGLGATFVFGDEGRLVVDDSAGPVSFTMNQRYVAATDTGGAPSAKVSMMTVNGDLDPALELTDFDHSGIDLVLPDASTTTLRVPLSVVDSVSPRPAPEDDYRPSVHVPKPQEPTVPLNVTGTPFNGAVVVQWDAPDNDGGSAITQYAVTSTPGNVQCVTSGARTCAVQGLTNGTDYTFSVVATNALGSSVPSEASGAVAPLGTLQALVRPTAPPNLRIEEATPVAVPGQSRYVDALVVSWDPEPNTSNVAPVRAYDVVITDLMTGATHACSTLGETTCAIPGLPPVDLLQLPLPYLAQYSVTVTATNQAGPSDPSALPLVSLPAPGLGETYVAPVVPPHPPYSPPPVLDVSLTSNNKVTFVVPGYVSMPQGIVRVAVEPTADASNKTVGLDGGVLAAWVDLTDPRPATFSLGLTNPATQRVIRIVTTAADSNITSEAVVQLNETGGWAVNSWVVQ